MKALAASLLIAASTAHAGDLMYAPNQANGAIVLTDSQGICPKGSQFYYATDGDKVVAGGCWMYSNPWVYARDTAGKNHQWLVDQFVVTDYAKSKYADK